MMNGSCMFANHFRLPSQSEGATSFMNTGLYTSTLANFCSRFKYIDDVGPPVPGRVISDAFSSKGGNFILMRLNLLCMLTQVVFIFIQ